MQRETKTMHVKEAMEEYLAAKRREMKPMTLSETRRIIGYFCEERRYAVRRRETQDCR